MAETQSERITRKVANLQKRIDAEAKRLHPWTIDEFNKSNKAGPDGTFRECVKPKPLGQIVLVLHPGTYILGGSQ